MILVRFVPRFTALVTKPARRLCTKCRRIEAELKRAGLSHPLLLLLLAPYSLFSARWGECNQERLKTSTSCPLYPRKMG